MDGMNGIRQALEEVSSALLILLGTCLFLFIVWTGVAVIGAPLTDPAASGGSGTGDAVHCISFSVIQVSFRVKLPAWLVDRLPTGAPCRNPVCRS
jgi:hypothetical protein